MKKLGSRPKDFFGPEDYLPGMDIGAEVIRVETRQREWDRAYMALPLWRRLTGFY